MTSERQIAANRRNARKSTGPTSQGGRDRAARNSFKHGLATSIADDARYLVALDKLALKIVGHTDDLNVLECARVIASAELELERMRRIRIGLIEGARVLGSIDEPPQGAAWKEQRPMTDADASTANAMRKALPHLQSTLRYERRVVAKRDKALRRLLQLRRET